MSAEPIHGLARVLRPQSGNACLGTVQPPRPLRGSAVAHVRSLAAVPVVAMLLALLFAIGCNGDATGSSSDQATGADGEARAHRIVTTVGMITDIVRQVTGEHATVEGLMREGIDPHLYKPTRSDVIALSEADVVFYNGLMLEGKMADTLLKIARDGRPVHAVTELISEDYVISDAQTDHYDPHVWMDVQGWMRAVQAVADAMSTFDPDRKATWDANAATYLRELELLDAYAREVIGSIPSEHRVLITAHDAFGYFGRAYNIEVRGIQGLSTESEAGINDINRLVDFLVERGIQAIFVESSVADKNVRALVEGALSRGHEVTIGGELFSDAMGPADTWEGTYIGMIDHNVTTIARALGGTAPAGGFREWRQGR